MSEVKGYSVAAVVVTYNRKRLLRECLRALLVQTRPLDEIIVIDNASTDGTDQMVPDEFPQVTYLRLPENTGGAGGFHQGMKLAYEKSHDWIWVMDDDGLPEPRTLEQLLFSAQMNNVLAIGPTILCKHKTENLFAPFNTMKTKEYFSRYGGALIYGVLPTFNGALYHKTVIKRVGYPDKELFIWGDEDDFRNRVMEHFEIAVTTHAIFYHPQLFDFKEGKFLFWEFKYDVSPTWKIYYQIRNHTYLSLYKKQKFSPLRELVKALVVDIKYRRRNKLKAIFYHIKAVFDGATKRTGRRINFIR